MKLLPSGMSTKRVSTFAMLEDSTSPHSPVTRWVDSSSFPFHHGFENWDQTLTQSVYKIQAVWAIRETVIIVPAAQHTGL